MEGLSTFSERFWNGQKKKANISLNRANRTGELVMSLENSR